MLFFSDNGGVLRVASNGLQRGEKATPYQGGIRVAAVARWPQGGIEGGKAIDARMGYIDIMPTLKRIVGLDEEAVNPFDGLDVSDAMQGNETLPDRPWFTYYDQNDDRQEKLAVNYDTFKLVVHRPAPDSDYNNATDIELFAIQEDTQEADNRVAVGGDRGDELLAEINGFLSLKQEKQIERFRVGREDFVAPKDWEAQED